MSRKIMISFFSDSQGPSEEILAEVRNVTLSGTSGDRLHNVSLSISAGVTAVVGYSGAGKTSLLNVLAGFELPDQGVVMRPAISGANAAPGLRLPLFWAPQGGGLWPHLTVAEHLAVVAATSRNESEAGRQSTIALAKFGQTRISSDELLAALDLKHRQKARPGELSQGERSRLAIARALASRAILLLLDEPLSHVDPARKPGYWDVIRSVSQSEGISVVFTSHEPDAVVRESSTVICLNEGSVVYRGSTRDLYDAPPDRMTGEFLGRLNWFAEEESKRWLTYADGDCSAFRSGGVRPERMTLRPDPVSSLELVTTVFHGGFSESVVRDTLSDQRLSVIHRSAGAIPIVGQRVGVVLS